MSAATAVAQQPVSSPDTNRSTALHVFLDCQDVGCDFDYFRTEITALDWVRDRQVADIHILVTGEATGAGGRDLVVTFIGLRGFDGLSDTLHVILPPGFTNDDRRTGLVQAFRAGLVRYLARTDQRGKLRISLGSADTNSGQMLASRDRWNAWVFRMSADGYTFGEETYRDYSVSGRFSANRITAAWKTQLSYRQNYSNDRFKLDSTWAENNRRNSNASLLQVRSLSAHWSAGFRTEASASTYENTRRSIRLAPAIEFNVFPYAQSTRRQFKFEYAAGLADYRYSDTTIYDKTAETLPLHRLQMSVSQRQPWGQVDFSVTGTQYLHDPSKYRISSNGELSVRIFKGFNVNFDGGYDDIHDQLSLAKKDYTAQEILLRQFQRGTTYSYFFSAGVSYTFGSIFNNVVNPRFD